MSHKAIGEAVMDELKNSVGVVLVARTQLRVRSNRYIAGEKQGVQIYNRTLPPILPASSVSYCIVSNVFPAIKAILKCGTRNGAIEGKSVREESREHEQTEMDAVQDICWMLFT